MIARRNRFNFCKSGSVQSSRENYVGSKAVVVETIDGRENHSYLETHPGFGRSGNHIAKFFDRRSKRVIKIPRRRVIYHSEIQQR